MPGDGRSGDPREESFLRQRIAMIERQLVSRGIRDERLIQVMLDVPRHRFIPGSVAERAYEDGPLPIGEGQTISQPYIVAEMTAALRIEETDKVLEIGTGTGYQTAILCRLARTVVTVERMGSLSERARASLAALGIENVTFHVGDGTLGAPQDAPFDRVIVTAAAPDVPSPLIDQMTEDGILVVPIGGRWEQELTVIHKEGGTLRRESLGGCRFVPLVGAYGFSD